MRKVEHYKYSVENGSHIVKFEGGNHNISDVIVKFKNETSGLLVVKYAQNGIITDLIDFDEVELTNQKEVKITAEIPASASHIYVFPKETRQRIFWWRRFYYAKNYR